MAGIGLQLVSAVDRQEWPGRTPTTSVPIDDSRASGASAQGVTSQLVVHTVSREADLASLEPEWMALEQTSGNTLPFRTAAWTLAWWTHLRRQSAAIRDSLALRTVRTQGGTLVGVAPLMLTESPGVGVLRARCLQFVGADPNVTELRGALWARGYENACFQAVKRDLARHGRDWDWMIWSGVPGDSAASPVLNDDATWRRTTPYYTLSLEGDWPTFKTALRGNIKESLRKCYNSLKRDGLEYSLGVLTTRVEIRRTLREFFRLHRERAMAPVAIRHPNVFARSDARAFLVDVCERLADRGQARVFQLRVGNRVVAMRIGFVFGSSLYLYYSGYEPAFGKYSVMTTLLSEIIQHGFATGLTSVNLSTGNDVSKTRWAPREWLEHEGITRSTRPLGRLAHGIYQLVDNASRSSEIRELALKLLARKRLTPADVAAPACDVATELPGPSHASVSGTVHEAA